MTIRNLTSTFILCAFVVGLAVADPLGAQDQKATATERAPSGKKVKGRSYKGTIEAIDASAKTLTVRKARTSRTFRLADNAKCVTTLDSNARVADLKPGDFVNVRFIDGTDMPVAYRIAYAAKKEATPAAK